MEKHTIIKEDGRYLIYYTFQEGSGSSCEKRVPVPAPVRSEQEVTRDHVGTEVEPDARGVGSNGNS